MTEWWHDFFLSGAYTVLENLPSELSQQQAAFAIRTLSLAPQMRVLDIACGVGRHSRELARAGMRVVGLDYTPSYLEMARTNADGLPAQFVRGDMRVLPFADGAFDAAVSFFNSFGYFEDEQDDLRALREAARVLSPSAPFLMDVLHRDGIVRRFEEKRAEPFADGDVSEERWWDARAGRIRSRWACRLPSGETQTLSTSNRVCTYGEIAHLLHTAGFAVENVWGDWDANPLGLEHDSMILAARKR